MLSFLNQIGPDVKNFTAYNEYESKVLEVYPIKREDFDRIDTEFFTYIQDDFKRLTSF